MPEELLDPDGRVMMVSGANRGIGTAIAERLYRDGYRLSLGVRELSSLASFDTATDDERVMAHHYEAKDSTTARAWADATVQRFGRIDGVINNAGILRSFRIDDNDEADLDEMWEVNVKGPLRVIRAAFAHLKRVETGRIINIVSLSGKRVKGESIGGYCMSKYAAMALTHAVRYAGWAEGIRTTAICPGYVATDMTSVGASIDQSAMTRPSAVAHVVAMVLALPNPVSVVEVPINCVLEPDV